MSCPDTRPAPHALAGAEPPRSFEPHPPMFTNSLARRSAAPRRARRVRKKPTDAAPIEVTPKPPSAGSHREKPGLLDTLKRSIARACPEAPSFACALLGTWAMRC